MYHLLIISCLISGLLFLSGCTPAVVVGAAATGAVMVDDRRTSEAFLQDQTIKFRSNDAIYSNQEIGTQVHINVLPYNQRVLLTGEAPTGPIRDQVESIVSGIPGVKSVFNEIKVMPRSRFEDRNRDAMITAKVKGSILRNSNVDATKIKVATEHAEVYLLGIVTEQEASTAVDIARKIEGVKRVVRVFEIIEEQEALPDEREISAEELNSEAQSELHQKQLDMLQNIQPYDPSQDNN